MASKNVVPVMYIILRRDIASMPGWGTGPLIAQGAHAATACIWEFRDDPLVQAYMDKSNIDSMHKVVLGAKDEPHLQQAVDKLKDKNIQYRIWVEDGMDVCVAVKPMPRNEIKPLLKGFDLY